MKNYYDIAIIGGGIGGHDDRLAPDRARSGPLGVHHGKGPQHREAHLPHRRQKGGQVHQVPVLRHHGGAGGRWGLLGRQICHLHRVRRLADRLFEARKTVIDYIEQADQILVSFGATTERFLPDNELKKLCLAHDLHMNQAQLKHLGTDSNFETMRRLIEQLRTRCDILTDTEVTDVDRQTLEITARSAKGEQQLHAGKVIFAVGRVGCRFFSGWCSRNGIPLENNQVDVGVRVELPAIVWEDFSKRIYEPKIWYRSKQYGDKTRMFCFNERGSVVTENTDGVLTVNGHSYRDQSQQDRKLQLRARSPPSASPSRSSSPSSYARHVASLANLISRRQRAGAAAGRPGKRPPHRRQARCASSTTRPTLSAVAGDLSLCMPKRQLDNIIETLHALDAVAPGTVNYDTLLYGIECKYYSARPQTENLPDQRLPEHLRHRGRRGLYPVALPGGGKRTVRRRPDLRAAVSRIAFAG